MLSARLPLSYSVSKATKAIKGRLAPVALTSPLYLLTAHILDVFTAHTQITMKSHFCTLLFALGCCFRGTFASPTMIRNKNHVQQQLHVIWPWRMTSPKVQTRQLEEPKKKKVAAVWSKVVFSQGEFNRPCPLCGREWSPPSQPTHLISPKFPTLS